MTAATEDRSRTGPAAGRDQGHPGSTSGPVDRGRSHPRRRRRSSGTRSGTNPRFHWGVVGHYFLSSRVLHGLLVTPRADRRSRWRSGIVLGDPARRDAPLAEPARLGRELGLHLALPRHAGARSAPLLEFISALYPRISLGIPFGGPALASRRSERADHAVRGRDPRARAERRRRTWRRSCGPGSSRSTRARTRRRRRSG